VSGPRILPPDGAGEKRRVSCKGVSRVADGVVKISDVSSVTGDGSGSAKSRERRKRSSCRDSHDTVDISPEARRRCRSEDALAVEDD